VGMITTGSINTLATKLADVTSAEGIDGTTSTFNHPFVQALGMFLGELSCLGAYYISLWKYGRDAKDKPFSPWIFLPPAMCDMAATSLMYVGLNLTYASVFQMLRGSVVMFTGIFSVIFLKRKLQLFHWIGMLFVLIGLAFVGLASVFSGGSDANAPNPILGDILIICAQVVVGVQMVLEEKYVARYNVPALKAVGLEGLFGLIGTSFFLLIFYYIPGQSAGNRLESTPDAFVQMSNSWVITLALVGTIVSISFFNFFGLSVTKTISATTRMVLDSIRTFVIWGISLGIGWQEFQYLQVIGFVLLLIGTFIYNKILVLPCLPADEVDKELHQIQEAEKDGMEEVLISEANKEDHSSRSHIDED